MSLFKHDESVNPTHIFRTFAQRLAAARHASAENWNPFPRRTSNRARRIVRVMVPPILPRCCQPVRAFRGSLPSGPRGRFGTRGGRKPVDGLAADHLVFSFPFEPPKGATEALGKGLTQSPAVRAHEKTRAASLRTTGLRPRLSPIAPTGALKAPLSRRRRSRVRPSRLTFARASSTVFPLQTGAWRLSGTWRLELGTSLRREAPA